MVPLRKDSIKSEQPGFYSSLLIQYVNPRKLEKTVSISKKPATKRSGPGNSISRARSSTRMTLFPVLRRDKFPE